MKYLYMLVSLSLLTVSSYSYANGEFPRLELQGDPVQDINAVITGDATTLSNDYQFHFTATDDVPDFVFKSNRAVPAGGSGQTADYGPQYIRGFQGQNLSQVDTVDFNGRTYYKYMGASPIPIYITLEQGVYSNASGKYEFVEIPFYLQSNAGVAKFNMGITSCAYNQSASSWGIQGACEVGGDMSITQPDGPAARESKIYVYFPTRPTEPVVLNNIEVARLYTGRYFEDDGNNQDMSFMFRRFTISGVITFKNICHTSTATRDVDLSEINASKFTTKGSMPRDYVAKEVTLTYECENDIIKFDGAGSVMWSVAATGTSDNNEAANGILKASAETGTIGNLGVGLSSDKGGKNKLNAKGTTNYTAKIDGTRATATFYAFPTMINNNKPTGGGDYKATATVRFDIP